MTGTLLRRVCCSQRLGTGTGIGRPVCLFKLVARFHLRARLLFSCDAQEDVLLNYNVATYIRVSVQGLRRGAPVPSVPMPGSATETNMGIRMLTICNLLVIPKDSSRSKKTF